jgi:PAS domain S-box-containing protein
MTGQGAEGPDLRGVTPFSRVSDWAQRALHIGKVLIYSCDVKSGRVQRSENSMEIVGLPVSGPTHRWSDSIFGEDLPYFENALKSITPQTPTFEVEYRIRHAVSGEWIWVVDRGGGEFGQNGERLHVHGAIVDISGRIGAETEIRDAARLKSVVYEAARMGAWHLDITSDKLTCSDELLKLLGIHRGDFDGKPKTIERIVHPADVESWQKAHATALTPGGRLEFEFRIVLPGGGTRWFLTRGEAVRDANGTATESYGVMFDITERKIAEEAAATLAAIVASSEDAIISTGLDGVVSSWNTGAQRLFGYTAKEMTGQPVSRIIPPDHAGEELATFNAITNGESIAPYDSIRLRQDGSRLDVSLTVSAIRNAGGQVMGTSTIARDITERHRHIEALRQNEERLSLALKGARAGAWDYDVTRGEMRWSPEMFILYGLDPASEEAPRGHFTAQVPSAHRARVQAAFTQAVSQGGSFNLEFPIVRPDGAEIWTAVMGDVIEDSSGRPIGARGIDQDITERKNWDKRQAMLLRELSHRVKNTMAVIQAMTRQTLRVSRDPQTFADAFEGRIRSLASSHNLLTDAEWRGAKLTDVITTQVGGMVDNMGTRFTLRGPDVVLPPETATQLGLVLHELGTNAVKYGALSAAAGHINLVWTVGQNKLLLTWSERGGPPITKLPTHEGFGTVLIDSSAASVERYFDSAGLTCKLELAL